MARYALDTNLLVYAHNVNAPLHEAAKEFVEAVMNDCDAAGNLQVCLPAQVLVEFLNVITWSRLESPLPIQQATSPTRATRSGGSLVSASHSTSHRPCAAVP